MVEFVFYELLFYFLIIKFFFWVSEQKSINRGFEFDLVLVDI